MYNDATGLPARLQMHAPNKTSSAATTEVGDGVGRACSRHPPLYAKRISIISQFSARLQQRTPHLWTRMVQGQQTLVHTPQQRSTAEAQPRPSCFFCFWSVMMKLATVVNVERRRVQENCGKISLVCVTITKLWSVAGLFNL